MFGLLAVAVPLLIHLLSRSKNRVIPFSSLTFLLELQQHKVRRIKLKQLLILILRMLIVILLVLAFARPIFKSRSANPADVNAGTTAVIVLDNSFSMTVPQNNSSLFQTAKAKINEIIQIMRQGDEVYLLFSTDSSYLNTQAFLNFENLQNSLKNKMTSFVVSDLNKAIDASQEIFHNTVNINKELYVISDFQKSTLPDSFSLTEQDVRIFALPVRPEFISNVSVDKVLLVNTILEKNKVLELEAVVANYGTQPVQNKLAQLFINDERVAQTTFSLEPDQSKTLFFKFVPDQSGLFSGYIVLEDDDVLKDNKHYFSFTIPDKIPVGLIGQRNADTQFINLALLPDDNSNFDVTTIKSGNFENVSLGQFQVVACRICQFQPKKITGYMGFCRKWWWIVLALGDFDLEDFNSTIAQQFHLPKLTGVYENKLASDDQFLSFGNIDFTHPVFKGIFKEPQTKIKNPHIFKAFQTEKSGDIDVIIPLSNGFPFLYEKNAGQGKIIVMTSGLGDEYSDFTYQTIFAPLMSRMFSYLAVHQQTQASEYNILDELRLSVDARLVDQDLEIIRPDNQAEKVTPTILSGGLYLKYAQTNIPGNYKLNSGQTQIAQWSVNISPEESVFKYYDNKELEKFHFNVLKESNIEQSVKNQRFGKELWKYFVLAALILLILEMLLFREKGDSASAE